MVAALAVDMQLSLILTQPNSRFRCLIVQNRLDIFQPSFRVVTRIG